MLSGAKLSWYQFIAEIIVSSYLLSEVLGLLPYSSTNHLPYSSTFFLIHLPLALRRVVEKPVLHPTSTVLLQWSTGFTDMKFLSCQGRPVRLILWVQNCQRWTPMIAWQLCHSCAQHFFCACATCVTFVLLALNWSLIIVEIDVWFQQNWLRSYLYLIILCM